jgi:hypothetical protein
MRARMFRDDLERVVDEIENSAVMWLGISQNAHGYDAIDIDDQVTVRGEVARLTRLYDKAVKTNTINDPDMYSTGAPGDPHSAALRDRTTLPAAITVQPPAATPAQAAAPAPAPAPAAEPPASDPDASPATKAPEAPKPKDPEPADKAAESTPAPPSDPAAPQSPAPAGATSGSIGGGSTNPPASTAAGSDSAGPAPAASSPDPDESPATAAKLEKHSEDTSKSNGDRK